MLDRLSSVLLLAGVVVTSTAFSVSTAGQPATKPTVTPLPRDSVEAACKSASVYLRSALSAGHAEATPQPPAPAGAPRWGTATSAAVIALSQRHRELRTEGQIARDWLRTANVPPEVRALALQAIRSPADALAKPRVTLVDEARRIAIGLAERRGVATDDELTQLAQVVLAAEAVDFQSAPPVPPDRVWGFLLQRLLSLQNPSGGWGQTVGVNARSISAAFSLITRFRQSSDARTLKAAEAAIEKAWLLLTIPNDPQGLYAVVVAARSLGRQYIGTQDVFLTAAQRLLALRNDDGSLGRATNRQERVIDTAAALQLLLLHEDRIGFAVFQPAAMGDGAFARLPVAMEYLCHQVSQDACTAWVWWERVSAATTLDDLYARILILPASVDLTAAEVALLRGYMDRGGLLLCLQDGFANDPPKRLEALAARLLPAGVYRPLPDNHPLLGQAYHRNLLKQIPASVGISGVSNGIRELLLAVHGTDVVKLWHAGRINSSRWSFHLATELHFVTQGSAWPDRLDRYARPGPPTPAPTTVEVAICIPGSGDIAEPHAWPRMEQILAADGVRVVASRQTFAQLDPARHKLCHLTGRGTFALSVDEKNAITDYVKRGGTLLIDPNNADADFAKAVHTTVLPLLGVAADADLSSIADDDPVATALPRPTRGAAFRLMIPVNEDVPRGLGLRQLTINGRRAILVSDYDLSAAMAGVESRHIRGYNVETGTEVVRLLLLSMKK